MKQRISILLSILILIMLASCSTSYTVTFESNGGTNVKSQSVQEGSKVEIPVIFRSGYILEGWYTSFNNGETFDEKWNFSTFSVNNDVILYAKWTLVNLEDALINITFLVDEYSFIVSGLYGEEVIMPNDLIEYNLNYFNRSYIEEWNKEIPQVFPNEDFTIIAITKNKEYTIHLIDLDSKRTTIYANTKDEIQNYIASNNNNYYFDDNFTDPFDINDINYSEIELYYKSRIRLSYADWGDQELNQQLIEAFMQEYPYIEVTLRSDISGSGDAFAGNLVTAAQAGLLPDVFATDYVPYVVNAGLTLDVAELWNNDPETELIFKNIAATAVYYGKRFAVPSFQFLKGIMINLDIFEEANLTTVEGQYRIDNDGYPVKDWTFEEFVNIASAIKDFDPNNYSGGYVLGLDTWYGTPDFQQVWPMMDDSEVGYDTWDGNQFNYSTSQSWQDAMAAKIEMHALTDGTTTRLDDEFLEANPDLVRYHILDGTAAMDIEGSWQFWVVNEAAANGINLGFWPYPQGDAGFFPPTILDYLAVSSETDYPEQAYLLAKWMSFGRQGFNARLDILEQNNNLAITNGESTQFLDRFPVADYPEVWERVNSFVEDIEGVEYILNNISNAKPDLDKWLPGYKDFWSWAFDPQNPWNFNDLVLAGVAYVPTWAIEWQNKMNEIVQDAITKLG